MDLREAVGIIGNVRNTNAKWDASFCEGAEWALKILRTVEGAWVDVSNVALPMRHQVCHMQGLIELEGDLFVCQKLRKPCPCNETIADDPRCPAVILNKGE